MSAFTVLRLLRKYWPIIRVVLALIWGNQRRLDGLIARSDTGPRQDARDFLRGSNWEDEAFDDNRG